MLHQGRIQLDMSGEEKARISVSDLVAKFGKSLKDETLLAAEC
ncbi:MAG: ABC transporter ATP-binding protein, partial [Desulfobacterales bacterium]|nr:ABC transporter ATP-binding protein [Desulfobacterales bacterium]